MKREDWKYKAANAKSCPFCGSESVCVLHKEVRYIGHNAYSIKKHKMKAYCICNKCHARGKPIFYIGYSNAGYGFYDSEHLPVYACGDKAVDAWNERKGL